MRHAWQATPGKAQGSEVHDRNHRLQGVSCRSRHPAEDVAHRGVARETGLEPATSGVTGRRSNQLSYSRFGGREALGREPTCVKREGTRNSICVRLNSGRR